MTDGFGACKETFDCDFDLETGRQIGSTKFTSNWRIREHQAAKLLEIYESGDKNTIRERLREVREKPEAYTVA